MSNESKIIFVYNADSGVINAIKDYFHKIFSPSTYECNLCGISWGLGGMKKDWINYVKGLPQPVEFLHRDEFESKYPNSEKNYPSAWVYNNNGLDLLIPSEEMNQLRNLTDLITVTNKKLKETNIL